MGKGFNNYMCKKFFHPASRDNLKRVWIAEQKDIAYKQKQEELRVQYEKEQDVFNNKALVSKESKEKLAVNFMYEPPPGMKKDHVKEEGEPEFKFEWQRKYNAPRESYCKDDTEIKDQPFGIPVRNVRCLKCRKWGHLNTDRECPLFASFSGVEAGSTGSDTFSLMRQMREDGLQMKRSAVNTLDSQPVEMEKVEEEVEQGDESYPEDINEEMEIVKSLSVKQKKKLLKKIKKLEKEKKREKKVMLAIIEQSSRRRGRHDSESEEEFVVKREKSSRRDEYESSRRDEYESSRRDEHESSRRNEYESSRRDEYESSRRDEHESSRRDEYESSRRNEYESSDIVIKREKSSVRDDRKSSELVAKREKSSRRDEYESSEFVVKREKSSRGDEYESSRKPEKSSREKRRERSSSRDEESKSKSEKYEKNRKRRCD